MKKLVISVLVGFSIICSEFAGAGSGVKMLSNSE